MGRLMTASCRASFVVIALIVASAGVVHQPAPSVRAASSPATLKAGGLNRPRGFVPRVHMGPQGSPRSNAASPNPNCSQCAPPLLLTRNYPVIGGLTGTPGHVTITPYFWEPPSYSYVSTTYLKLIDRFSTSTSYLWWKAGPPGEMILGSPMPLTGGPLTLAQMATIRDWITGGAPDN